jgi:enamine deaminase RidA (YjgF/YER057c/UK114 family)
MQIQRHDSGKRISQAVVYGGFVFMAGQVADDTSLDVKGQTAQVLAKIDRLLEKVGSD